MNHPPLAVRSDGVLLRRAVVSDVPALVALLADDPIGSIRESTDLSGYLLAFAAVDADPGELLVAGLDGAVMLGWAIDEAARRGCGLVQLTADVQRSEAHRFYASLGFTASHVGLKLQL